MNANQKFLKLIEETLVLLELTEPNSARTNFYKKAIPFLNEFKGDLQTGFDSLPRENSNETLDPHTLHKKIMKQVPKGLLDMALIPQLGAKGAKEIFEALDIASLGELEYACKENRLIMTKKFDLKTQKSILEEVMLRKKNQKSFLLSESLLEAAILIKILRQKTNSRIEIVGSIRRWSPTVKNINFLTSAKDQKAFLEEVKSQPSVYTVLADKEKTGHFIITLTNGMLCHLTFASEEEFPFALRYLTGSLEHNDALKIYAKSKGFDLTEKGLFKDGLPIKCTSEEEIFEKLKLDFIEPELRENCGEIQAAEKKALPLLVRRDQIRGIFHCHTTSSDGSNSLEEMVSAAQKLGFEYIGVSEHSQTAEGANGLDKARILEQFKKIESIQRKYKIRIFKGIESEIKEDGTLDYEDDLLSKFDFVIGSIHSHLNLSEEKMTSRVLRAMENPFLDILGHLTNRLLLVREGVSLNIPEIIEKARALRVTIEFNANPHSMEIDWHFGHLLKEKKVLTCINPDAHSVWALHDVDFGVAVARKGWFEKGNVLNTFPADSVLKNMRRSLIKGA